MKKTFVAVVLCMALLSSFIVSASAYDVNDIYIQVTAIRNELGYPQGNWSSLRRAINYIADNLPSSPKDYSTFLSNIYSNTSSISSILSNLYDVNSGLVQRVIEIQSKIDASNQHLGTISSFLGTIDSHIGSGFELNHFDLTAFQQLFDTRFASYQHSNNPDGVFPYFADYYDTSSSSFKNFAFSWGEYLGNVYLSLSKDVSLYSDSTGYRRSLYGLISQLQQVLASDDDLQLKNDNKANEDAATDAFVNGSSSNTSLGPADFGNLKDVGGSFNDLTSLNGQSSVTSFLNGLSSADGTGQGWFSEVTRASLDAVSPAPTYKVRAYDVYRGERSSTYVILPDVSLVSPDMYSEPVDVASSVSSDDPYNMSGFEDNYNWLWGDAS